MKLNRTVNCTGAPVLAEVQIPFRTKFSARPFLHNNPLKRYEDNATTGTFYANLSLAVLGLGVFLDSFVNRNFFDKVLCQASARFYWLAYIQKRTKKINGTQYQIPA